MVSRLVLGCAAFGPLLVLVWFGPRVEDWRQRRTQRLVWRELERDIETDRDAA